MLWIVILGIVMDSRILTRTFGYYQGYASTGASSDYSPYTRVYYSSSPHQYNSNYAPNNDQYTSASTNPAAYTLTSPEQDPNQAQRYAAYSNSLDDSYQGGDELSYPQADDTQYQSGSYDPNSNGVAADFSSNPGTYYREQENSKIEVSSQNDLQPLPSSYHQIPNFQPLPPSTLHANIEPVPITHQHIHVIKQIPVPVYKHVHVPVAKPIRVEIPHPIIIPVPRPYQVKIPIAQPVAVPVVREITIPVEKVIPFPVEKRVPYTVEKHVPYKVEKHITVPVPQVYPVRVPIIKTIIHKVKTYGRLHVPISGWN